VRRLVNRRDERGATIVEAAFVLPVLMFLMLGLIDLALWDFQTSQASSAARDGARTAILGATGADVTGNAANTAVQTAVASRLGGKSFTFTVRCMSETTTTTKTCLAGPQTVDRDRIEVHVTWTRPAMTFVSRMVGASSTVSATSTMTISG
jgi:Flp pilus assembly protein TadG